MPLALSDGKKSRGPVWRLTLLSALKRTLSMQTKMFILSTFPGLSPPGIGKNLLIADTLDDFTCLNLRLQADIEQIKFSCVMGVTGKLLEV